MIQKDHEAKEALDSKNQIKYRLKKYNEKLIGKPILRDARYVIWDQLDLQVTKIITYLETMQEDFETTNDSMHKCDIVAQELT